MNHLINQKKVHKRLLLQISKLQTKIKANTLIYINVTKTSNTKKFWKSVQISEVGALNAAKVSVDQEIMQEKSTSKVQRRQLMNDVNIIEYRYLIKLIFNYTCS